MPATSTRSTMLSGGCDCGGLALEFTTALEPATITPRACDCSFCRKHGAAYISDPAGRLSVRETHPGALRRCRQGSNTAEFLFCGECGVLIAVTFESDSRLYGAVNASCLDGPTGLGASAIASPKALAPEEKVSRWLALWVPDVELLLSVA